MSELDMRHKNIGATVALIKGVHVLTDDEKLPESLAELFILESDDCNYKQDNHCIFEVDPEPCISPAKCMIANCPLGDLTEPALDEAADLIMSIGD
jgi:hypothetical protein